MTPIFTATDLRIEAINFAEWCKLNGYYFLNLQGKHCWRDSNYTAYTGAEVYKLYLTTKNKNK